MTTGFLFRNAPCCFSTINSSLLAIFFTIPYSISDRVIFPIARETEKKGIPLITFLVPSTGSNTNKYSPSLSINPASSLKRSTETSAFFMAFIATSSAILSIYFVGVPSAPISIVLASLYGSFLIVERIFLSIFLTISFARILNSSSISSLIISLNVDKYYGVFF